MLQFASTANTASRCHIHTFSYTITEEGKKKKRKRKEPCTAHCHKSRRVLQQAGTYVKEGAEQLHVCLPHLPGGLALLPGQLMPA